MPKKKQRGGKRPGAGRPTSPEGPSILVAVTVPESLMNQLDAIAKRKVWGRSRAVTEAIRGFVAVSNRR